MLGARDIRPGITLQVKDQVSLFADQKRKMLYQKISKLRLRLVLAHFCYDEVI